MQVQSAAAPVSAEQPQLKRIELPESDILRLYQLQEQVWKGVDRSSPYIRGQIRSSLDDSVRQHAPKIQTVFQDVIGDSYETMMENTIIPADRKPLVDELVWRLSSAVAVALSGRELQNWMTEKPLAQRLLGKDADYQQMLSRTAGYTWVA